jgi:hypothetical protein
MGSNLSFLDKNLYFFKIIFMKTTYFDFVKHLYQNLPYLCQKSKLIIAKKKHLIFCTKFI